MTFAMFALVGVALISMAPRRGGVPRVDLGRPGRPSAWQVSDEFLIRWIRRTDIELDPRAVRRAWIAMAVTGAAGSAMISGLSSLVAVVVGTALGLAAPMAIGLVRRDRSSMRVVASLPEMLELIARSLRGGADLHTALRDVSGGSNEAGRTLGSVLERIDAGERLGEAMDRWVVALGHQDAAIVRAVIRLGDTTGGSMANALNGAAATLRERSALRAEIRALTSQSRASAMVVALSPLAFLVVVAATDPRSSHVLFSTNLGRMCLIGGLFLDGVGLFWMHSLTAAVSS